MEITKSVALAHSGVKATLLTRPELFCKEYRQTLAKARNSGHQRVLT